MGGMLEEIYFLYFILHLYFLRPVMLLQNVFFFIAIDESKINRTNAEQGRGEKSLGPGCKYIAPRKILYCEEVNFVEVNQKLFNNRRNLRLI